MNNESLFHNELSKSSPKKRNRDVDDYHFSQKSSIKMDTISEYERIVAEVERKR
jgi:hypothetical protein